MMVIKLLYKRSKFYEGRAWENIELFLLEIGHQIFYNSFSRASKLNNNSIFIYDIQPKQFNAVYNL